MSNLDFKLLLMFYNVLMYYPKTVNNNLNI